MKKGNKSLPHLTSRMGSINASLMAIPLMISVKIRMPSYFSFCYEFCYRSILAKKWNKNLKYERTGCVPMYERNIEARSHCYFCHGKAVLPILIVCLQLQLYGIQSACAVPYCHMLLLLLYNIFFTLFYERHDFREEEGGGELLDIKCVF